MWVRGLKLKLLLLKVVYCVAPYVGAWIETKQLVRLAPMPTSHPMWVRGLELSVCFVGLILKSYALCGCVYKTLPL